MSYLGKLIEYMLFAFFYFALIIFVVCRKELCYYACRLAHKFKSSKKEKAIKTTDVIETSTAKKPDTMKFVGKIICCLPILVIGYIFSTFAVYRPDGGYPDDSIDTMLWLIVASFIVALLLVIIGLLLCCYSRLRNNDCDIAELHALVARQQSENEDAENLNVASVIDLFDRSHNNEDI